MQEPNCEQVIKDANAEWRKNNPTAEVEIPRVRIITTEQYEIELIQKVLGIIIGHIRPDGEFRSFDFGEIEALNEVVREWKKVQT